MDRGLPRGHRLPVFFTTGVRIDSLDLSPRAVCSSVTLPVCPPRVTLFELPPAGAREPLEFRYTLVDPD